MTGSATNLVSLALIDVEFLNTLDIPQWDLFVRQARAADLLSRIAVQAERRQDRIPVPEGPDRHLHAARIVARAQAEEVMREAEYVRKALAPVGVKPVFLKGAAYLLAGLPAATGRVFSDLDLLVPKTLLPQVESSLMLHGWATTHHDPYDQRYYRQWMHELPPFEHIQRQTVLDVHHGILPETARLRPESRLLLDAAVPVLGHPDLLVLAPTDMVLHSMTHLFHNEELSHGLRDLSDLDMLLRHFGEEPAFWDRLVDRAEQLDLRRPLHYGLRYTKLLLATPVPGAAIDRTRNWGPAWPLRHLMDALWSRALCPRHDSIADGATPAALFLLYVRAHWLRMPPLLLFYHLTVKTLRREPTAAE